MARVKIALPTVFHFTTKLEVRIEHLNYGAHLGNDRLLAFAHEARVRFLAKLGLKELMEDQSGLIMTDSIVSYKAEAFWGDELIFSLGFGETGPRSFELIYEVRNQDDKEVARIQTGLVFFDYKLRKITKAPLSYSPLTELYS